MTTPSSGRGPRPLGGIIHGYQKYDPKLVPGPEAAGGGGEVDLAGAAFEHMMAFGSLEHLTDAQLAEAVEIDPSEIAGLGPSLAALIAELEARKRKILETWETRRVLEEADRNYRAQAAEIQPPEGLAQDFRRAVRDEQIRELEGLWFRAEHADPRFAADLLHLVERLGEKYQVEMLDAAYTFTGRAAMDVSRALAVKEELEQIDALLEQLRDAEENAQVARVDLEALAEYVSEAEVEGLRQLRQQVEDLVRQMAERQGLEREHAGYRLSPRAYRAMQGRLLETIFSDLEASRSGRHESRTPGEGPVELARTRPWAFGDSPAHMDIPQSFLNAILRERAASGAGGGTGGGSGLRVHLKSEDIEVHETRNHPKCATCVAMDMSGSMRHGGQYIHCKRMALALDGLIRRTYPGDTLHFLEMATLARPRHVSELAALMPKPVTLHDPVVRLMADMSRPELSESALPPHFTNVQHALHLARRLLGAQDTPNRQIILITDGLPTAHFEAHELYMLYPPDPRTEQATLREGLACAREGITINIFLLPSFSQSREDVQFAQRLAESTRGRVIFTGGGDLDRFVLWDYVNQRREVM